MIPNKKISAEQTARLQRSRVMEKLAVGSVAERVRLLAQLDLRP